MNGRTIAKGPLPAAAANADGALLVDAAVLRVAVLVQRRARGGGSGNARLSRSINTQERKEERKSGDALKPRSSQW